jgi:RNA ligase (TIGR02306 family)
MLPLASIQTIVSVVPHPNADQLDLAKVLGYSCVIKKGSFAAGDRCIFIQPDSVLPQAPWSAFYRAKSSRVRAIKLRGEWSFGIIESFANLGYNDITVEGLDLSDYFGITKYSPPEPQDLSASGPYGNGIPKTDEEKYQNIRDLPFGELVDVFLKVDGQSLSYVWSYDAATDTYSKQVGGRSFLFHSDVQNNYTRNIKALNADARIEEYLRNHKAQLCFRGESYGQGIQTRSVNPHAKVPLGLAFFSIWDIEAARYARKGDKFYFVNICRELGLPMVKMIEENVVLTPELLKKYDEQLEQINGQPFEGVVIQHAKGSFKVINKHYDAKK